MNIHEHQAKELFRDYNIPVSTGSVAFSKDQIEQSVNDVSGPIWVVKAQIHAGGRGKGGGVKVVSSSEAGLKYFLLGALSSGLLLFGLSYIYGFTGNTNLNLISTTVTSGNIGLIIGIVFVCSGIAFKVSAVPFHMWTPDVYEGAPTPVTAFFALAPKVAALALAVRFLVVGFGDIAFTISFAILRSKT